MRRCSVLLLFVLLILRDTPACGQAPPSFDLMGPKVDVHVKRGEATLPIGQVPNLLPGDRLWIHPDLPESQSTRLVLIVAFLRGATNPPPAEWLTRVDTWDKKVRTEGVFVTVPAEAQQAVLFLLPSTGGDFSTLRNAVRGRPGTFVRATQDLQAASLDRMRLDAYLAEVKVTSQTDPKLLKDRAQKAASVLGIRLDQQCFDKPTDQQAPCLTQHTEGLVLDDANVSNRVLTANERQRRGPDESAELLGAGRGRGVQPLYRGCCRYDPDIGFIAYGTFPVHSGACAAYERHAELAFKHPTIFP